MAAVGVVIAEIAKYLHIEVQIFSGGCAEGVDSPPQAAVSLYRITADIININYHHFSDCKPSI
jgi:hypothetical protein